MGHCDICAITSHIWVCVGRLWCNQSKGCADDQDYFVQVLHFLNIWICPIHSAQEDHHYQEENWLCFWILFHKSFCILWIFWSTHCHDPGHIFYSWLENDIHLPWHYSMGMVILLLYVILAWSTFVAPFPVGRELVQNLLIAIHYLESLTLYK